MNQTQSGNTADLMDQCGACEPKIIIIKVNDYVMGQIKAAHMVKSDMHVRHCLSKGHMAACLKQS